MLSRAVRWVAVEGLLRPPYSVYGDCPLCGIYIVLYLRGSPSVHRGQGRDVHLHMCSGTSVSHIGIRFPSSIVLRRGLRQWNHFFKG